MSVQAIVSPMLEQARQLLAREASLLAHYQARVRESAEAAGKLRADYGRHEQGWIKPHHEDVTLEWEKPRHFELWNFNTMPSECVAWSWGSAKKGSNTKGALPRSDSKTTTGDIYLPDPAAKRKYFESLGWRLYGQVPGALIGRADSGSHPTSIRSRICWRGIEKGTLEITAEGEYLGGLDDVHKPVSKKYLPEEWVPGEYHGVLAEWTRSQDKAPEGLHEEEKDEITKAAQLVRSKKITPTEADIYNSRAFNTGFKEIKAPESDPDREEKKQQVKDEVRERILAGEKLSEGEVITTLGFLEDEPVADTALVAGITMDAEKKRRQRLGGNSKAFKKAWSKLPADSRATGWYVYVKLPGKGPTMFPLYIERKPTIEEADGVRTDAETWAAINAARWAEARKACRLAVAAFLRKRRKLRDGIDANGAITAEGADLCQSVWSEVYEAFKRGEVCWWTQL